MANDSIQASGYNQEDDYFHNKDRELLAAKRTQLDAERKERAAETLKTEHWMKCPKCGQDMTEIEMQKIMIDRCTACNGLYFDEGELELMIEANTERGVLAGIKKMFGS